MIDPRLIREKPDAVKASFKKRGMEFDLQRVIAIDEKRRELIRQVETLKSERNKTSDEIAQLKKTGAGCC